MLRQLKSGSHRGLPLPYLLVHRSGLHTTPLQKSGRW